MQTIAYQLSANPQNMALKNYKIVNEVKVLWRLVAVGNGSKIPLFVFFNTFNTSPRYLVGFFYKICTYQNFFRQKYFLTLEICGGGISVYLCPNFELLLY